MGHNGLYSYVTHICLHMKRIWMLINGFIEKCYFHEFYLGTLSLLSAYYLIHLTMNTWRKHEIDLTGQFLVTANVVMLALFCIQNTMSDFLQTRW